MEDEMVSLRAEVAEMKRLLAAERANKQYNSSMVYWLCLRPISERPGSNPSGTTK